MIYRSPHGVLVVTGKLYTNATCCNVIPPASVPPIRENHEDKLWQEVMKTFGGP